MKKIILSLAIITSALAAFAINPPDVNENVKNIFNKTFKNAKDISWYAFANNIYEVKFSQNEIKVRMDYDKDGNVLRTIRYYTEEQLPLLVLSKLKMAYPQQTIYAVVEESTAEGISYNVTMQDAKKWYIIKADVSGAISGLKKYNKA